MTKMYGTLGHEEFDELMKNARNSRGVAIVEHFGRLKTALTKMLEFLTARR